LSGRVWLSNNKIKFRSQIRTNDLQKNDSPYTLPLIPLESGVICAIHEAGFLVGEASFGASLITEVGA